MYVYVIIMHYVSIFYIYPWYMYFYGMSTFMCVYMVLIAYVHEKLYRCTYVCIDIYAEK